jgi:hypothetical protein
VTFLGLSLAFAPLKRGHTRQTTAGAITGAVALAVVALVRPGPIYVWAAGAALAFGLAECYLSDCGHAWSALALRQRVAAVLFLAAAACCGLVAGYLVQQLAN